MMDLKVKFGLGTGLGAAAALRARARIAAMPVEAAAIAANVKRVRERIALAAARVGRRADEITLVAVSKTFPADAIRAAYATGLRHFGENRVQEWETKKPLLADLDASWHLIGHLQSNKARRAARLFHEVDSVDSLSLAQKLSAASADFFRVPSRIADARHAAPGVGARLAVLIEVRLGAEESKTGVSEADLPALAEAILALPDLELRGLTVIPPYFDEPEQVRPFFHRLCELRDDLSRRLGHALLELSMGMSHDFEVAIEEGATQVRLGSAVFGARATP